MTENQSKPNSDNQQENRSETEKSKRKHYTYNQFTASPQEKVLVEKYAKLEYSTISDFLRRVIFDYIRRKEHPELFLSPHEGEVNTIVLERMHQVILEIRENQEYLLQREDVIDDLREMVTSLFKKAEAKVLAKERNTIIELLEQHSSLSMKQLQDKTGFPEDIVFKILSDMSTFKLTQSGRFSLR